MHSKCWSSVGSSEASDDCSRVRARKWKSTESAHDRKTMALLTEPFRANVRLRSAVRVTSLSFAGTTR